MIHAAKYFLSHAINVKINCNNYHHQLMYCATMKTCVEHLKYTSICGFMRCRTFYEQLYAKSKYFEKPIAVYNKNHSDQMSMHILPLLHETAKTSLIDAWKTLAIIIILLLKKTDKLYWDEKKIIMKKS